MVQGSGIGKGPAGLTVSTVVPPPSSVDTAKVTVLPRPDKSDLLIMYSTILLEILNVTSAPVLDQLQSLPLLVYS